MDTVKICFPLTNWNMLPVILHNSLFICYYTSPLLYFVWTNNNIHKNIIFDIYVKPTENT